MFFSYYFRLQLLPRAVLRLVAWGLIVFVLSGCAAKVNRAVDDFYANQPQEALEQLEKGWGWGTNNNQLLALLERGTILFELGRYEDSITAFLQADKLVEGYEQVSLSEQGLSLVSNDWLSRYKGEYSERLWINSYLMMNYLLIGRYDDALVEANRALLRFEKNPEALRKAWFTRALMALSYANVAEDNDALLVYRRLAEDLANDSVVAADISYHARRLGMADVVDRFAPKSIYQRKDNDAELVIFFSSGRIAEKEQGDIFIPPSHRFSFPYYRSVTRFNPYLVPSQGRVYGRISTDLDEVAVAALDKRKSAIIAKETIRIAAREALAQSLSKQNHDAAEALVRVAFFLIENADIRSWKTLPGQLSLLRVVLPPGRHRLSLQSSRSDRRIDIPEFELRPGQRYYHSIRFMP